MIELVHTSVPHGLLSGDGGFCTVAATKDVPAALRQRLEQLSSYKHLVSAPGPQYERGNPVAWSHLVLQTGEHLLSCVRACDFDYTNRTNRIARHWCFSPREVPAGTNFADVLLHGAAEELSTPWSGEPRWLPPRSGSPLAASIDRSDCRPVAWNALFGESRGPALAAGFAAALLHAVRDGGRGVVFKTSPAADADGVRALGLFADLLALVPADFRPRVVFSTYPATLPSWMPRHLVCLQSGDPALAACATFVDLVKGTVEGAERLPQDPDLLHLAQYGRKQAPPPAIRPFASSEPIRPAPSPGRTPVAPTGRPVRVPSGRLVSKIQVKKAKPEDILIYVLCVAIVCATAVVVWLFMFKPSHQQDQQQASQEPDVISNKVADVKTDAKPAISTSSSPKTSPVPEPKTNAFPKTVSMPTRDETKPENSKQPRVEGISQSRPTDLLLAATNIVFKEPDARRWSGKGWWYYYDLQNQWTNVSVEVVTGIGKTFKKHPSSKLAFNETKKTIYWCNPTETATGWFSDGKPIDLRSFFFGPDPMFDVMTTVLSRQTGEKQAESYSVSFAKELDNDNNWRTLPNSINRKLEMANIVSEINRQKTETFDKKIEELGAALSKENQDLADASNKWASALNTLKPLDSEYAEVTNRIAVLNQQKKGKKGAALDSINAQLSKENENKSKLDKQLPGARKNEEQAKKVFDNQKGKVEKIQGDLKQEQQNRQAFLSDPSTRNMLSRLQFRIAPVFPKLNRQ